MRNALLRRQMRVILTTQKNSSGPRRCSGAECSIWGFFQAGTEQEFLRRSTRLQRRIELAARWAWPMEVSLVSNTSTPIVFVVDSDASVRASLESLIRAAGWRPQTFATAQEFLDHPRSFVPCCLILDVVLPDVSGLALQQRVASERSGMPIIFLTGKADIAMTVRAMKAGALEFLIKPFDAKALMMAMQQAIHRSEAALGREHQMHALRTDYRSLTQREREVMTLVVSGLLNKEVGGELGISEITVKAHRGSVMRKMKADSFANLVNMASRLRIGRSTVMSPAWA
jgi:FixJ family two-component response regulator